MEICTMENPRYFFDKYGRLMYFPCAPIHVEAPLLLPNVYGSNSSSSNSGVNSMNIRKSKSLTHKLRANPKSKLRANPKSKLRANPKSKLRANVR